MAEKEPLSWKDEDGSTIYGIPDLNRTIQKHNKFLEKYYKLAIVLLIFIMGVVFWAIWQIKKYKIITLLINNIGVC